MSKPASSPAVMDESAFDIPLSALVRRISKLPQSNNATSPSPSSSLPLSPSKPQTPPQSSGIRTAAFRRNLKGSVSLSAVERRKQSKQPLTSEKTVTESDLLLSKAADLNFSWDQFRSGDVWREGGDEDSKEESDERGGDGESSPREDVGASASRLHDVQGTSPMFSTNESHEPPPSARRPDAEDTRVSSSLSPSFSPSLSLRQQTLVSSVVGVLPSSTPSLSATSPPNSHTHTSILQGRSGVLPSETRPAELQEDVSVSSLQGSPVNEQSGVSTSKTDEAVVSGSSVESSAMGGQSGVSPLKADDTESLRGVSDASTRLRGVENIQRGVLDALRGVSDSHRGVGDDQNAHPKGWTRLQWACARGDLSAVQELVLVKGVALTGPTRRPRGHGATEEGESEEGVDDDEGRVEIDCSPLHIAADFGRSDIIRFLLTPISSTQRRYGGSAREATFSRLKRDVDGCWRVYANPSSPSNLSHCLSHTTDDLEETLYNYRIDLLMQRGWSCSFPSASNSVLNNSYTSAADGLSKPGLAVGESTHTHNCDNSKTSGANDSYNSALNNSSDSYCGGTGYLDQLINAIDSGERSETGGVKSSSAGGREKAVVRRKGWRGGATALMVAAGRGDYAACMAMLEVNIPSVLLARDDDGDSALHWAVRAGAENVVVLLCQYGALRAFVRNV